MFFLPSLLFMCFFFFRSMKGPVLPTVSLIPSLFVLFLFPFCFTSLFFFLYCCYPGNRFAENYVYCLLNKERKVPKSSSTIILFLFSLYMYFLLLFFFCCCCFVRNDAWIALSSLPHFSHSSFIYKYINIYKYKYISTYIYIYIYICTYIYTYIFL